jgi:hypothetical protein
MLPNSQEFAPIDLDRFSDELRLLGQSNGKVWITARGGVLGSSYHCGLSNLRNPASIVFSVSPEHFITLDLTQCTISTANYNDANQIIQMYNIETATQKFVISTAAIF